MAPGEGLGQADSGRAWRGAPGSDNGKGLSTMRTVRFLGLLAIGLTALGLVAAAGYIIYIARLWSQAMKA